MVPHQNGNSLQYFCLGIPWTEEPGRLQSTGSQRVRHDWATEHTQLTYSVEGSFLIAWILWKICWKLQAFLENAWVLSQIWFCNSRLRTSSLGNEVRPKHSTHSHHPGAGWCQHFGWPSLTPTTPNRPHQLCSLGTEWRRSFHFHTRKQTNLQVSLHKCHPTTLYRESMAGFSKAPL